MRLCTLASCLLVSCTPAPPPAVTLAAPPPRPQAPLAERAPLPAADDRITADARLWAALVDRLCRETGGATYGDAVAEVQDKPGIARVASHDVWFSLARAAFFASGASALSTDASPWLGAVATAFRKALAGARLVVTVTLEDDVRAWPVASRVALASRRKAALEAALRGAGLGLAAVTVVAPISAWEGSYDGPATLDPADGLVTLAVRR